MTKTLSPKPASPRLGGPHALNKNDPKIIFFGTPKIGEIVLEALIVNGLPPIAVITREDKPAGRGQKPTPPQVKILAEKHKIEVLQPKKLKENPVISHKLYAIKPDLGIVAAYGRIIPKEIIDNFKYGILNVHPSFLPKYRGASPVQSAILAGEKETGATIMLLDEELDHGPIIAQQKLAIAPNDTTESLKEKLASLGAKLLIKTIPDWLEGKIKPKGQDHKKATFTSMFKREDGYIDLKKPPNPAKFQQMVNAFYPWPGTWTQLKTANKKLIAIKFLPGNLIQPEGKRPLTIEEFRNGYQEMFRKLAKLLLQKQVQS